MMIYKNILFIKRLEIMLSHFHPEVILIIQDVERGFRQDLDFAIFQLFSCLSSTWLVELKHFRKKQ